MSRGILSLLSTILADPDLFRAAMGYIGAVTPAQELLRRPGVAEGIRAAKQAMKDGPAMQMPGPNRDQPLDLVK